MPSLTSMTMPQLVTAQSPTLPISVVPKCPPNAATWFVDTHAQMTKVELGCHFHALIAAWVWVEAASRYKQGPTKLYNQSSSTSQKLDREGTGKAAM
jgi:hypothetical protein